MSLILDALNRADQERSDGDKAPSIRTVHAPIQQADKSLKHWVVAGVVLLLALLVIAYLLFANQASTATSTVSPTAAPVAVVTTTDTKAIPASPATPEPKPSPVAPLAQATDSDAITSTAKPIATTVAQQKTTKSDPAIALLYEQSEPSAEQQAAAQTKAAPAITPTPNVANTVNRATAKEPVDITATVLAQLPYLAELPTRFQNTVPSIDYSIHIYSDTEDSGAVNLNGSMRRVGHEIEPGLRVIAILKDSVVMDYRGTQFRLIALNSWVNFK